MRAVNFRHALRALLKTPFVTTVAVLSLSLGIGANAAMFSVFYEAILRPLPVPSPERLVNLVARVSQAHRFRTSPQGAWSRIFQRRNALSDWNVLCSSYGS